LVKNVQEYEALFEEYKSLSDKLKESLARAEKSEDKLRSILEHSSNVFFRHNVHHKLTYLSPQVKEILGYTPEEAMIKWTELITDNPLNEKGIERTNAAIETGERQEAYELELYHKSGEKVYVEVREAPVVKHGKTIAIVGGLVDITDRKKAYEDLLQNRYFLKKAQEIGNIGTWELDIQNDKLVWTEQNYKIFEIPPGEPMNVGKFLERVHPDDRNYVWEKWLGALKKEGYDIEHRLLVNNKIKWLRQKAFVEFDKNDQPVKATGFSQDITNYKQAQNKLHESEQRYQLLYENAGIGVGYYDVNGNAITYNHIGLNQIGKTKNEVVGKNVKDFLPEDLAETLLFRIKSIVKNQKVKEFEDKVQLTSTARWFLSNYSCIKKGDGAVAGVQVMSMDITKQKKIEKKLRESQQKFKSYINNAPDGIFLVNKYGDYLDVNSAGCKMTGYSRAEMLTMNIADFVLPGEEGFSLKQFEQLKVAGELSQRTGFLTKSGTKRYWSIDAVKLSENEFLGFSRDITDRIEYEEKIKTQNIDLEKSLKQVNSTTKELQIAKNRAEESDRLKSAFLANMSHEIRTPMNGILGFIELLLSAKISNEKTSQYLSMMQKSGDRLLHTINDIIEISKIEAGQAFNNNKPENLNEILNYQHAFFKPEAESKGIKLILKTDIDKKEVINIDRTKLESILSNIIKNAIKYTEKGKIEFGCQKHDNRLLFFVKDTGVGIPEDRLEAVFDRFVQADLKISRPYEGSGLGLSIAKAYVEMLGGKIWVESSVGKGSAFYFLLYAEDNTQVRVAKEKQIHNFDEIKLDSKKLLLIVEDDSASRSLLETILDSENFSLLFAEYGNEAIDLCKQYPHVDLILMDLKMPHMDGYEATRKIKEFCDAPVIAQTAYALPGDKEKILEEGFADYISKPIKREELLGKVYRFFEGSQLN